MRPYPEEVLRIIQGGVVAHFVPELTSNYGKAQFAFSMLLFGVAQQRMDSAVPDLIEANTAIRGLLAEASDALASIDRDDARAGRATIAGLAAASNSLKLSALRAENDALRAVLASLAPLIEPAADVEQLAPLRDVRVKVYAHLSADAKTRVVPILSA
jgi:hypothetical protein